MAILASMLDPISILSKTKDKKLFLRPLVVWLIICTMASRCHDALQHNYSFMFQSIYHNVCISDRIFITCVYVCENM